MDAGGDGAVYLHLIVPRLPFSVPFAVRRRRQRTLRALARPDIVCGRALIRLCIARHCREIRMADALNLRATLDADGVGLRHLIVEFGGTAQGNPRPVRRIRQKRELERAEIALARLRVDAASRIEIYVVGTKERARPVDTDGIPARDVRCECRTCRTRKTSLRVGIHLIADLGIVSRRKCDIRICLCSREMTVDGIDGVIIGHAEAAVHHGERNHTRRFHDAGGLGCALCEALRGDPRIARCLCTAVLKCDLCRLRHVRGDLARTQRARAVAARRVLVRVAEHILRLVVLRADRLDLRVLYGDSCVLSERLCQPRAAAADDCRLKRIDIMQ